MLKDAGLVADVQSRASGAQGNWNRPFNDQSVAHYKGYAECPKKWVLPEFLDGPRFIKDSRKFYIT